jgi:signal transduction histidine kinase
MTIVTTAPTAEAVAETTGPTTGETTEADRPRWRLTVPVRLRITAAVVILSALALAGAGVVVYLVENSRIERSTNSAIEQEIAEFERLVQRGDPATQQPFATYEELFRSTLARNVPNEGEFLFAVWDGRRNPLYIGEERYQAVVFDDEFRSEVEQRAGLGGSGTFEGAGGVYRYAVKVAQSSSDSGYVAFVYDMEVQRAELVDLMRTYAVVAGAALLVVAFGAFVISGRLLRPLRDLRDTARDISAGDLSRRIEVTGNDDLTDLTRTFNSMLDRLAATFRNQRQFLDDVGHELKTPITIVQGHLELMREGDPAEVGVTRDLVLDEMNRMSRLVEELILLAKTQRPDFLQPEYVDVAGLTSTLYDKMRALAPRDWRLDSAAPVAAVLDPQRITQALLQLASNAVRHTDEHALIAVGSAVDDEGLRFWVRDTGDGIDPADQARIFERFRRGTAEGEGSGLGLAIVRGIARAHGGDVSVASALGQGATFVITIPREQPWATGS